MDPRLETWLPLMIAVGGWFAGYEYGMRRGVTRGHREAWHSRSLTTYVELPCFGGPRDGEMIRFDSSCEQLHVPHVERPLHPMTWEMHPEGPPIIRQARYQRLWIGDREQLVYQGTVGD